MSGFGKRATDFFAALENDNSREFWLAHADTFEAAVRAPMAELIASLPDRHQPFRVFRMNRDVRFSADKSPYKLMHGAAHDDGGAVDYLHLDADGLLVACGAYLLTPDQLERFRAAVDDARSGPELERVLGGLDRAGLEVGPGGAEPLKTAPRGYRRDHPRIELLRRKGVIASARLRGRDLRDGRLVRQFAIEVLEAGAPLAGWLRTHVGPAEVPTTPAGTRRR